MFEKLGYFRSSASTGRRQRTVAPIRPTTLFYRFKQTNKNVLYQRIIILPLSAHILRLNACNTVTIPKRQVGKLSLSNVLLIREGIMYYIYNSYFMSLRPFYSTKKKLSIPYGNYYNNGCSVSNGILHTLYMP